MDGVAGIDMETNRQGRVETIFTEYSIFFWIT